MKNKAIWASAHNPSQEQINSLDSLGFNTVLLKDVDEALFQELTNLGHDSNREELANRILALDCKMVVQPAGDPALHLALGRASNKHRGPAILFSFSKRVSEDIPQADGTVKKVAIFKHEGWV